MTTETTRRCRAWLDCGNVSVPLADLSFRGFCPHCEAVANGGQLPLVVTHARLWGPNDLYRHQVHYQAENGTSWPLFTIDDTSSTVSDTRLGQLLERMVSAYNGTLGHVHNTDECDPDGHVVFTSVCCGAQLYRCAATEDGLPSKPLIHQGEDACRSCGEPLAQF